MTFSTGVPNSVLEQLLPQVVSTTCMCVCVCVQVYMLYTICMSVYMCMWV